VKASLFIQPESSKKMKKENFCNNDFVWHHLLNYRYRNPNSVFHAENWPSKNSWLVVRFNVLLQRSNSPAHNWSNTSNNLVKETRGTCASSNKQLNKITSG
jgi:hypothetical protein